MHCPATRKNLILAFALATTFIGSRAFAQEVVTSKKYSAEIKPLPMVLTLLPGGVGIGAEFEAKTGDHMSIFAEVNHMRLRLTDDTLEDVQKDQGDEPESVPSVAMATSVGAGARYYGDLYADSWYLGGKLAAGTSHVEWAYEDERLDDDSLSYRTELGAGYRWLWDNGFLVRLGVGVGATTTPKRTVAAVTQGDRYDQAREDVEDKSPDKTVVTTAFDLGLGYSF